MTGSEPAQYAGPALIISIVITAISVRLTALFYAEFTLTNTYERRSSGYLYTVLGEFPAWIAGWLTLMEFLTAVSSVASGWGAYLKGLLAHFGISMPTALNGTSSPACGYSVRPLPVLVLFFVIGVVLLNSKAALRFNSALVLFKILCLGLVCDCWYVLYRTVQLG